MTLCNFSLFPAAFSLFPIFFQHFHSKFSPPVTQTNATNTETPKIIVFHILIPVFKQGTRRQFCLHTKQALKKLDIISRKGEL
jgi:hypothetical protein